MDILSLLLQLSFFAVFGAAVWRYLRRRGPIELALVAVFSTTAAIFAIPLLDTLVPGISDTLRRLAMILLLAQPVLVFRLVSLIRALPRWSFALVLAGFGLAAALILIPPDILPAAAVFVACYFALVEGPAAALLLKESQHQESAESAKPKQDARSADRHGMLPGLGQAGQA